MQQAVVVIKTVKHKFPVIEGSIFAARSIAAKRNISIELLSSQKTLPLVGDKGGLQQVFINLINNIYSHIAKFLA